MTEMFLTVEQAAERLQLSPVTIRRQIKSGVLPGVRRGRVYRIPESALSQSIPPRTPALRTPAPVDALGPLADADYLWAEMASGDQSRGAAARVALARAPVAVREEIMRRSGEVAARFYATPEGQAELADWRALDGEPFHDDAGDYYSPEEEAQFRAEREAATR